MDDAIGDSDDEADFSKMDLGNKKGPVGRFVIAVAMWSALINFSLLVQVGL